MYIFVFAAYKLMVVVDILFSFLCYFKGVSVGMGMTGMMDTLKAGDVLNKQVWFIYY